MHSQSLITIPLTGNNNNKPLNASPIPATGLLSTDIARYCLLSTLYDLSLFMVLILSFILQPERPRENGKERTEAISYEPDVDVTPRSDSSLSPFRSARTRTVLTHSFLLLP